MISINRYTCKTITLSIPYGTDHMQPLGRDTSISILPNRNCMLCLIATLLSFMKCLVSLSQGKYELIGRSEGICNPEFYGDLVYKFKKIIGNPNFSYLFKRNVNRFKRTGYTLDIMRQTACLVLTQ